MRAALVWCALAAGCSGPATPEQAGALLFSYLDLSNPSGQSCADCHAPGAAFRDPESSHSSSAGVVPGRFGSRNAPTAMYARFTPPLHYDPALGSWVGGQFWDGRAATLEAQAAVPLMNPLEMNNPDKARVVAAVRKSRYAAMLREAFGPAALDDDTTGFAHILEAIAAFERTAQFAPFASKYDRYLAGKATLTASEAHGLALFEDPARGNCAC